MPEVAWYIYLLAIAAGVVAGIINTLAGSGSLVTLPMLAVLGLPADLANGTNRVGVLLQNVVGIATYRRSESVSITEQRWLIWPTVAGALVGATIAVFLDKSSMQLAIGIVMVVMLFVILMNPKQWLRETSEAVPHRPGWIKLLVFFAIGIYGGFIQAGVGILLLSAMVLGAGFTMNQANLIKLVIVLIFTLFVLPVFVFCEKVNWPIGVLMAIGQGIGAWLAARYATRVPNANVWIRRLLIVLVSVGIVKFLMF
jgi:uncharacterized membrane protein YfcA